MGVLEMMEAEGLVEITPSRRAALEKLDELEAKVLSFEARLAWVEAALEVQTLIDQRIDRLARIAQQMLDAPG